MTTPPISMGPDLRSPAAILAAERRERRTSQTSQALGGVTVAIPVTAGALWLGDIWMLLAPATLAAGILAAPSLPSLTGKDRLPGPPAMIWALGVFAGLSALTSSPGFGLLWAAAVLGLDWLWCDRVRSVIAFTSVPLVALAGTGGGDALVIVLVWFAFLAGTLLSLRADDVDQCRQAPILVPGSPRWSPGIAGRPIVQLVVAGALVAGVGLPLVVGLVPGVDFPRTDIDYGLGFENLPFLDRIDVASFWSWLPVINAPSFPWSLPRVDLGDLPLFPLRGLFDVLFGWWPERGVSIPTPSIPAVGGLSASPQALSLVVAVLLGVPLLWFAYRAGYQHRQEERDRLAARSWGATYLAGLEKAGGKVRRPRIGAESPERYCRSLAETVLPGEDLRAVGPILSASLYGDQLPDDSVRRWAESVLVQVQEAAREAAAGEKSRVRWRERGGRKSR